MLSLVIVAILGQFKEGDTVSVKPPGARAWKTSSLAAARYTDSQATGSLRNQGRDLPQSLTSYFQKREKLTILTIDTYDGEKLAKVKTDRNDTWWVIAADLSLVDADQKSQENRESLTEKYKPFCVTKPEHEALTVVINKGLDPITMTAEQAKALSASQRRAISSIKARYVRANGKK